jgi:hypothetical protein
MPHLSLATRCEALFVSDLQSSEQPDSRQVRSAIVSTIQTFGRQYCVTRVAQEFGDHPDIAVARMRWAREAVRRAYSADPSSVISPRTAACAAGMLPNRPAW